MLVFLLLLLPIVGVVQSSGKSERIIGGQFATPGQFPYQVSMVINGRHFCGGAFISDSYIITAAHCVVNQNPGEARIIAGSVDLQSNEGSMHEVEQLIAHPNYIRQVQDYDLGLIKLKKPVELGDNIKTIELVDEGVSYPKDDAIATVSGYGAVNHQFQPSSHLKFTQIQVWSRQYCHPQYIPMLTDRMICAGHPSGQMNACPGDSGGPMTLDGKLIGVVSWGFGCGYPGRPAIYTNVSVLRQWIKEVSGV